MGWAGRKGLVLVSHLCLVVALVWTAGNVGNDHHHFPRSELDRERTSLERQQKKTMNDLKKSAKEGQLDAAKIMAKDIVRTKRYVKKMIMMKTQIQAVSLKIQTLKSTNSMAKAMKGVTKVGPRISRLWEKERGVGCAHPLRLRTAAPSLNPPPNPHPSPPQPPGHGHDEQANEPAGDAEDHDGV